MSASTETIPIRNILIGDTLLKYKNIEGKYMITYINEYNEDLNRYLNDIFIEISRFYYLKSIEKRNVCFANVEFICKNLNIPGTRVGKIILTDLYSKNGEEIKKVYGDIKKVYGNIIGTYHHALAYLVVIIDETTYHIAIETTRDMLQFYVGTSEEELKKIIQTRYQCEDFKISFDCDKPWNEIALAFPGGKKRKYLTKKRRQLTKKRRQLTKKRKQKKRFHKL
jgi:hypothetical protein